MNTSSALPDADAQHMEAVQVALRQRFGIEVPPYQTKVLRPLVERLGGAGGLGGGVDRLLSRDIVAWNAVIETITIPETYFFRHYPHFDQLASLAADRFRNGRACHVLSAGCSSGEEAWSAVAVVEAAARGVGGRFGVVGWDVHGPRLDEAREGRYRDWSVRSGLHAHPDAVLRVGDHWQVARHLLPHARFEIVNLVESLPEVGPRFDAIFFRNVAIYFRPAVARQVAERLSKLLVPDGLFFVGPCDPVSLPTEEFEHLIVHGVRTYRRRRSVAQGTSSTRTELSVETRKQIPQSIRPAARRESTLEMHGRIRASMRPVAPRTGRDARADRARPTTKPRQVDPTRDETSVSAQTALAEVEALADRGEYHAALARLAGVDEVSARGSMLEGVLRMNLEQFDDAVRCFRRAVYLDADSATYRRWLSVAYEAAGMPSDAERERRNALEPRMR